MNIEKRGSRFLALLVISLMFLSVFSSSVLGVAPNPGHSVNQIKGGIGETLDLNGGKIQNVADLEVEGKIDTSSANGIFIQKPLCLGSSASNDCKGTWADVISGASGIFNTLLDGSFEQEFKHWPILDSTGGAPTIVTTGVQHGTRAIRFNSGNTGGTTIFSNQYIRVFPGETITISCWKKGSVLTANIFALKGRFYEKNLGELTSSPADLPLEDSLSTTTWTQSSDSFTVPNSAVYFRIKELGIAGTAQGDVYIDNCKIETSLQENDNLGGTIWVGNGNVGIGTSTPGAKLHLAGNMKIDGSNTLEFGAGVASKGGAAGQIGYQVWEKDGNKDALDIVGAGTLIGNRKVRIYDHLDVDGTLTIGTICSSGKVLTTTSSGVLSCVDSGSVGGSGTVNTIAKFTGTSIIGDSVITESGGNVGIGTTSLDPTAKLDVVGKLKTTGFQLTTGAVNGKVLTSDAAGIGTWQSLPASVELDTLQTVTDRGATTTNTITLGGITGPTGSNLVITSPFNSYIDLRPNSDTYGLIIRQNGNTLNWANLEVSETYFAISKNGQDQFVIENSGNVGIGTTDPTGKLGIKTGAGGTGIQLEIDTGSGNAPFILWKPDAATNNRFGIRADTSALRLGYLPDGGGFDNNVVINTAGNVGIGTSTPGAKLHLKGNMKIDGSNTLEFGAGVPGKGGAAGEIGYQVWGNNDALDIVGAGTSIGTRKVKIYDHLEVDGSIKSGGKLVCLEDGTNCQAIANVGWTDDGTVVRLSTVTDNVGIGTSTPGSYKLNVAGAMQISSALGDGSFVCTNCIGAADIAVNAIGSGEVIDNSLTNLDIAVNAIGSGEVIDNSIKGIDILDSTIGTADIADDSITGVDIDESLLSGTASALNVGGADQARAVWGTDFNFVSNPSRGSGGRALVHDFGDTLFINYGTPADFVGGVVIGGSVVINNLKMNITRFNFSNSAQAINPLGIHAFCYLSEFAVANSLRCDVDGISGSTWQIEIFNMGNNEACEVMCVDFG